MPTYRVIWEMDMFDAENFEDAARKALEIQRDPNSIANVFQVINRDTQKSVIIDLDERDERAKNEKQNAR